MAFGTTTGNIDLPYMVGTFHGDNPRIITQLNDLDSNLRILTDKLELLSQDLNPILKKGGPRTLGVGKVLSTNTQTEPSEVSKMIEDANDKIAEALTKISNLRNNLDI